MAMPEVEIGEEGESKEPPCSSSLSPSSPMPEVEIGEEGESEEEHGGSFPQQLRCQAQSGQRLLYRPGDVPAPACSDHAWSEVVWCPGHHLCIAYLIRGHRHVVPHTGMVAGNDRSRRRAHDRAGSAHRWAMVGRDRGDLPCGLHQRTPL